MLKLYDEEEEIIKYLKNISDYKDKLDIFALFTWIMDKNWEEINEEAEGKE